MNADIAGCVEARLPEGRMQERRRFSRREAASERVTLPGLQNVRVLDISSTGVLIQATRSLPLGTRGSLRLTLAGIPFQAEIAVRRVGRIPGEPSGYSIGAAFVDIAAEHQHLIDQFIVQ